MTASADLASPRRRLGPGHFVLGSFLVCAAILSILPTPTRVLRGFTDHLRHPSCAYAALERGADVYRVRWETLEEQSAYRHKIREWPGRYIYPPGALLVFMPMALLGQFTPLSEEAYRLVCALYVLALGHLALWLMLKRMLKLPRGWSVAAMSIAWIACARSGLTGQYEPLWLAAAVCMLAAVEERKIGAALAWLGVAALLHYRAITLLPFGIAVALPLLKTAPKLWPWKALAFALCCGALSLVCFLAAVGDTGHQYLIGRPRDPLFVVDVLVTLAGIGLAWREKNLFLALTILLIGAVGLVDWQHWWHASPVLVPLLARDTGRKWEHPAFTTAGLAAWAVGMQYVWINRPLEMFRDLWRAFL